MSRRPWFPIAALALLASLAGAEETTPAASPQPTAASEAAPRESIERLHAALLDASTRAAELGFDGRVSRLQPVVESTYDLPFMAEKVLGGHWKRLEEEDQQRWVGSFSRLTVSTYAARFDGSGEFDLTVRGSEPAARETWLVRTQVLPSHEEPVELDYRMRERDGQWLIIDVYLNGTVSELALRRSEYTSLLRRKDFDSLLEAIEQKIVDASEGRTEGLVSSR